MSYVLIKSLFLKLGVSNVNVYQKLKCELLSSPQISLPFGNEVGVGGEGRKVGDYMCLCFGTCSCLFPNGGSRSCTPLILVCLVEGLLFIPLLFLDTANPSLPQGLCSCSLPGPLSPQILTWLAPTCHSGLGPERSSLLNKSNLK